MNNVDWKVELKKIEREYEGLPPEPSPAELRARRTAEEREKQRNDEMAATVGAWTRFGLVVSLAASLQLWPYARDCGEGLFLYVGAEGMLVAGGLWVAVCTWRNRMPKTHCLAMLMTLYGLALLEMQVLPRVGYAKVDAKNPPQLWCAAPVAERMSR
jgi:hypothetical protein